MDKLGHFLNLEKLPLTPGVYLMKDQADKILYIGKAISLKNRVRSYFQNSSQLSDRIRLMLSKLKSIDWIVTGSELEALTLESNLIKKHKPPFNVVLKDDKHFPFLRLSLQERFPRLKIVRKVKKDGALYFGPYIPTRAVRNSLKFIYKFFALRQCKDKLKENSFRRPCLNYQLKRCVAPCNGLISKESYNQIVRKIILFLRGKNKTLLNELKKDMQSASEELNFELAAKLRDQIRAIEQVSQKQKIISPDGLDRDIIAGYGEGKETCLVILFIRGGKLIGNKGIKLMLHPGTKKEEFLSSFLKQYYHKDTFIPQEILLEEKVKEEQLIAEWLGMERGKKIRISVPRRGEKLHLIKMAQENARALFLKEKNLQQKIGEELIRIKRYLDLKKIPERIEAFDFSHISGSFAVGAMVVFIKGIKVKEEYRHYRIRKVKAADDYVLLKEVLRRRYDKEGKISPRRLPDLIIIDGGKGQLNSARQILEGLLSQGIEIIGISKGKKRNNPDTDEIHLVNSPEAKAIKDLRLLQEMRNEAHRFALSYHQKLRKTEYLCSLLEKVPQIGKTRSRTLLSYSGSIENIKKAKIEELSQIPTINKKIARAIKNLL